MCTKSPQEERSFLICIVVRSDVPTRPNEAYIREEMLPWMARNLTDGWLIEAITAPPAYWSACSMISIHSPPEAAEAARTCLWRFEEMRLYFRSTNDATKWRMFYEFGWKGLRRMNEKARDEKLGTLDGLP